jgi:hypothetical protein
MNGSSTPGSPARKVIARSDLSEGPAFASQVADFDTLLRSQGVAHTLLTRAKFAHNWSGGWLPDALAGLFAPARLSDRDTGPPG